MIRCFHCFCEYEDYLKECPSCHTPEITGPREPVYLAPGTVLAGRYLIGDTEGAGGFGIVYRAWDMKLCTVVAVKEFFAGRLMTRAVGEKQVIVNRKGQEEFDYRKERFLTEARNMAKFSGHRSIPNVYEYFEENGTAYIVMELLEGMALNQYLAENGGKIDRDLAMMIAEEVANALDSLHKEKIIHRDVAPDNIFICTGREIRIKLMDLGAAKLEDSSDEVIDIILKPGYSPTEQYDNSKNIGPWTDIYALGATLYMMLTGVKPEESTNRKIFDTVQYPRELDPDIPENLSNTVMKAMAVDRHLRFQKVEDFLKALNGKKKISTVEKEKKRRAMRRLFSILAACVVLAVIGVGVWKYFDMKNAEVDLKEATIQLWYPLEEGSARQGAIDSVLADFKEKFPKVTVEARAIPAADYDAELEKAAAEGKLPHLFYSSGASDAVLAAARSAETVLKSDQAKECLFLDQYDRYYAEKKQIPLGFEMPVAAVITAGPAAVSYENDYFTAPADFGADTAITLDTRHEALIAKNFGTDGFGRELNAFMNNEANTSPVLLTSTMAINEVRETLTFYTKRFVFPNGSSVCGRFLYEWSLGEGTKDEKAAAERLLSWMLGNVYQNTLMISEASEGELPLNETCLLAKLETRYLVPVKEIYKKVMFER